MEKNQKIKCDVTNCRHNLDNYICSLSEIKVGCQEGCKPKSPKETVCDSYKYDATKPMK